MSPALSIVVLSWNTRELLRACLKTVLEQDHGLELEVLVVDNDSHDGSAELVAAEFPAAKLLCNERNEGYAKGNNQGIQKATAPFILLLNSDTEVRPGALRKLVSYLEENPTCGAVAPRLVHPDGGVQRSCMRFPGLRVAFLYDSWLDRRLGKTRIIRDYFMDDFDHLTSRDVDQPPGAAFLLRRTVIEKVGMFDEDLFLFFNDVDFCQRITAAGYQIHYLAEAEVLHHIGKSTSQFRDFIAEWNINRVRYYRKHHGLRGTWVVKLAVLLRALEESWKILRKAPTGEKGPGLREVRSVLARTLRA